MMLHYDSLNRRRNILDKLGVTYQRAFTASEKPSSVPPAAYISPLQEKYWDL